MEKILKKVKDFEDVFFASSEYAQEQLKKFKLAEFNSNIHPYADSESYDDMEDEIKGNKNNSSKNSFKGEFKDCVKHFPKQDYKDNEKEQSFMDGFNLRDAIIAKEILDKPLCKRRRRGVRGGR